jgi:hypothetical protein
MSNASLAMIGAAMLVTIGGCGGARDVDYRPSRGISADIDATYQTGATTLMRGRTTRTEPYGSFPWQLDQRHESGP